MKPKSQREMFQTYDGSLVPGRIPRLTAGGQRVLAALLVREMVAYHATSPLSDIMGLQYNGGYITRSLKRLIREGCVEARAGSPATLTVTRLGRIARELHK